MRQSLVFFILFIAATLNAQLTTQRAGTSQLLIPAAGAVTGANGTFFRSDITVVNYRTDADQRVRFTWLAQGANGIGAPTTDMTLTKATGFTSEDFVTNVLKQSGLGSILVTALDANGNIDAGGKLHATARIWSNQPGLSSGTVSQSFPVMAVSDINVTGERLLILSQRRDDRYRTNLGIINLDPQAQTFRVTVQSSERTEGLIVQLQPLSMTQVSLTGPAVTNLQIGVENATSGFQTARFVAYGSTVDNTTGDSWSSLGFVPPQ